MREGREKAGSGERERKVVNAMESNKKKKKRVAACPNSSELQTKSLLFRLKISIIYLHISIAPYFPSLLHPSRPSNLPQRKGLPL